MSIKDKDKYVSYPNLENVKKLSKVLAFRAGAAYWICTKAMGGENSMSAW